MRRQALDVTRQALTIVGAIFQVVAAVLTGPAVGEIANDLRSTILPAGYAFAIWTPIFLLAGVYAVWQTLPANREHPLARRVGWLIAAGYIGNGLWELVFPAKQFLLAQILITLILVVLAVAYTRVSRAASLTSWGGAETWRVAMPLGLFFGWITAATCVGLASTLIAFGVAATGTGAAVGGAALLLGGGALAVAMLRIGQGGPPALRLAYAVAVVWALIGVAVNQLAPSPLTGAAALTIAAVVVAVTIWQGMDAAASRRALPSAT